MESGFMSPPAGFDGTQAYYNASGDRAAGPSRLAGHILRGTALLLTLLSAILMGTARENLTIIVTDTTTNTTDIFTATVKANYSAAFVYFIIINAIVCAYTAISLVISIINKSGSRKTDLLVTITDILLMVLLFTCNGAAIAIQIIAEYGQSRIGWLQICNLVGVWCHRITASIVLSMFGALAYVLFVILALISLHKRYP